MSALSAARAFSAICPVAAFHRFSSCQNRAGAIRPGCRRYRMAQLCRRAEQQPLFPLEQITAANFNDLEVAWRFKTDFLGNRPEYQFEATPLLIKGRLSSGSRRDIVYLDAVTGEMIWLHREDEGEEAQRRAASIVRRGVTYWSDGRKTGSSLLLWLSHDPLDARTGVPVKGFGVNGVVDLRALPLTTRTWT